VSGRSGGLAALEARVRHDLEILSYPSSDWLTPARSRGGRHVHDVAIVGAGQAGLAIAFALRRERVTNVALFDRLPAGHEGPWLTFARMPTLRTPKYLTGPDLGIPSLAFRAWFEAQPRLGAWSELVRIPREMWMDYLNWYRRVLDIAVENETEVRSVGPAPEGFVALATGRGDVLARKVVLANGMEGGGEWWVPEDLSAALPRRVYCHTAEAIDFATLRGRRVAIVGIGASAADNAAAALQAGAARVDVFCRRDSLPKIEARAWIEHVGFLRHFFELDDARKWRIMRRFWEAGAPAPPWSLELAASLPGFHLHVGAPWIGTSWSGSEIVTTTPEGEHRFDFVIFATGLVVDVKRRPELAAIAGDIASWGDKYAPPPGEECPPLAACPYLGRGYELTERVPGAAPWLRNIHLFNWAATPSNGISASSITGMKFGVPRLVAALTRDLYFSIADEHAAAFPAHGSRTE
jgi:cation diffusion facilitator CzcD-associated flavoprotein CzcO